MENQNTSAVTQTHSSGNYTRNITSFDKMYDWTGQSLAYSFGSVLPENSMEKIQFFPNPTSDFLQFEWEENEEIEYEIMDLRGISLRKTTHFSGKKIYVNGLPNGIYLIHLKGQGSQKQAIGKFLKARF